MTADTGIAAGVGAGSKDSAVVEASIGKAPSTISAGAGTDIWRTPYLPGPTHERFNAPHTPLSISGAGPAGGASTTYIRLSEFKSVRVAVSAAYRLKFDQGGLLLKFWPTASSLPEQAASVPSSTSTSSSSSSSHEASSAPSWIKLGVEFFQDQPQVSFVGCDRWSDWSIAASRTPAAESKIVVELANEEGALWAYQVAGGEGKQKWPLRECTWPLEHMAEGVMQVCLYAARPAEREDAGAGAPVRDTIEVHFEDLALHVVQQN